MIFNFKIRFNSTKSQARAGIIQTAHGEIATPAFVPCTTNAVVKGGVDVEDLQSIGCQAVLGNTYHLFVRDQVQVIKKAGGLGKFMNFKGPTFTDSGGYQVFSLGQRLEEGVGKFQNYDTFSQEKNVTLPVRRSYSEGRSLSKGDKENGKPLDRLKATIKSRRKSLVKISEKSVEFRSHLNGQLLKISPEDSMRLQSDIGADMIFAFDIPTSPADSHEKTKVALDLTNRWALRCLEAHKKAQSRRSVPNKDQVLFGIIQGGPYEDLRAESAKFIADQAFPGFGIGGSYHRPDKATKFKELDSVIPYLPDDKPRHFLGIGGIEDILTAVRQGIDTFDCVIPTREARHGRIYRFKSEIRSTKSETPKSFASGQTNSKFKILNSKKPFYEVINITNAKHKNNHQSINNSSLKDYSHAYLHHLFKTQELLGVRLATINNLEFYFQFMKDIRTAIKNEHF